jgi:hypothetical protein
VYSNLGVLAVITWQVLFISIPMVYLAIRLQVFLLCTYSSGFYSLIV